MTTSGKQDKVEEPKEEVKAPEVKEVEPEVFDELVESGEYVQVGEEVEALPLAEPDYYATQPSSHHIPPDVTDPEVIEQNKNAYKEAAEHAEKANSEA